MAPRPATLGRVVRSTRRSGAMRCAQPRQPRLRARLPPHAGHRCRVPCRHRMARLRQSPLRAHAAPTAGRSSARAFVGRSCRPSWWAWRPGWCLRAARCRAVVALLPAVRRADLADRPDGGDGHVQVGRRAEGAPVALARSALKGLQRHTGPVPTSLRGRVLDPGPGADDRADGGQHDALGKGPARLLRPRKRPAHGRPSCRSAGLDQLSAVSPSPSAAAGSGRSTSSTNAIGALSPTRKPIFRMRV